MKIDKDRSARPKVFLGNWDGLPIWRYKTAGEILLEELEKQDELKKQETVHDIRIEVSEEKFKQEK